MPPESLDTENLLKLFSSENLFLLSELSGTKTLRLKKR